MRENVLWEDRNEILPLLQDRVVVKALAQFIGCTIEHLEEAVRLRMKDGEPAYVELKGNKYTKQVDGGYHTFKVPKNIAATEFRTISAPAEVIKNVQKQLVLSLRQIPISGAAQGGEPGTSPKRNALQHKLGSYLYTTDIKSAYPSVSAQRMYKNLEGGLGKYVDMTFPHLSHEQREHFYHLLVTLLSHNNSLPQGAPTSARMLNMSFAKTDKQISSFLYGEDREVEGAKYTRYIDDMAISFKAFRGSSRSMVALESAIQQVDRLRGYLPETDETRGVINEVLASIDAALEVPVVIQDETTRAKIRSLYLSLVDTLLDAKNNPYAAQHYDYKQQLFTKVHQIHTALKGSNTQDATDSFGQLRSEIRRIVNANGWQLKMSKEKHRGPDAATAKEITGVMIGPDGRIGIAKNKMERYVSLAKLACLTPSKLPQKFLDPQGNVDALQLSYALNGIRNFIVDVKGRSPEYFEKWYQGARAKYFSKVPSHPKGYAFAGGSNGGVWN